MAPVPFRFQCRARAAIGDPRITNELRQFQRDIDQPAGIEYHPEDSVYDPSSAGSASATTLTPPSRSPAIAKRQVSGYVRVWRGTVRRGALLASEHVGFRP
jgi:hypothetical protein